MEKQMSIVISITEYNPTFSVIFEDIKYYVSVKNDNLY